MKLDDLRKQLFGTEQMKKTDELVKKVEQGEITEEEALAIIEQQRPRIKIHIPV